jgi:hypothetical protein
MNRQPSSWQDVLLKIEFSMEFHVNNFTEVNLTLAYYLFFLFFHIRRDPILRVKVWNSYLLASLTIPTSRTIIQRQLTNS